MEATHIIFHAHGLSLKILPSVINVVEQLSGF